MLDAVRGNVDNDPVKGETIEVVPCAILTESC